MKYLITESQINNVIERFLYKKFPEVVNVNFKKKKVMLASTKETKEVNVIAILIDPYNLLTSNDFTNIVQYSLSDIKKEISDSLEKYFKIDWRQYGSDWHVEVYSIGLK